MDCYHCGGRGIVLNADEYDEQCPECAKRGAPDPLTRAERQVAAMRDVLNGLPGDIGTGLAKDEFDRGMVTGARIAADRMRRALEETQ